ERRHLDVRSRRSCAHGGVHCSPGADLCNRQLWHRNALVLPDRGCRSGSHRSRRVLQRPRRCAGRSHARPHYPSNQARHIDREGAVNMNSYSNSSSFGSADWLMSAVKKHPEGLLLLAAGCALLLRSGSASAQGSQGPGQYQRYSGSQTGYGGGGQDWRMREGMSRAADTAREYASDVGKTLSDTADNVGKTLSEKADRVGQTSEEHT